MIGKRLLPCLALCLSLFASCDVASPRPAIVWTDTPDLVSIAQIYNAAQGRYKVEIFYRENPVADLDKSTNPPDIIIASWLKDSKNRRHFLPLDDLFEDRIIDERAFYPKLLAQGHFGARQYLLPVSFNIPAFVFSSEQAPLFDTPFVLPPDRAREASTAFNRIKGEQDDRMGYAPRWDDTFLITLTRLMGADWHEDSPLAWDSTGLSASVDWLRSWTSEVNGSIETEEEFTFSWLNVPRTRLLANGTILLSCMATRELFTLSADQRSLLDFRWIAKDGIIPVQEDSVWLGLCKKGRARSPARDFASWFFREDSWRDMLSFHQKTRTADTVFGVANGFSALKTVNEKIYPQVYSSLLGHIPPEEFLHVPAVLPNNWERFREDAIIPWLRKTIAEESPPDEEALRALVLDRSNEYQRIKY